MPDAFVDRLRAIQQSKNSAVCVGLDPDPSRLPSPLSGADAPADAVAKFCYEIVEATAEYACAFKLNFAFFEALGPEGATVLEHTASIIPENCIIIGDAKRGDIGNSARFYATAVFDHMHCDAITVAPYMGRDSVTPFLEKEDTCAFVLARTSNPGARDFQEACVCDDEPLYLRTAKLVNEWNDDHAGTAGLVAGATSPEALRELRQACPTLPFLVPGVGSQGGDPTAVMNAAATDEGLVVVNSSRSVIYASEDEDYADAAARAAKSLRDVLNGDAGA
ncbi:orotidine-5'-phosphate decarboxylase [Longibacter salinarum]|uniref:Orotidine 5'-phosphate decarboxylase n=1 Tax=Longibacter salinarum TaxID=1850348 RepID=A0A2A8CZ27_9BACT|nr:orotidine-5'-phosphate decarboxylase [Longibacter salinarum]PEN13906.1 orotidine-5'-phosphate decarboxylase [Longibacter salinarum]